MLPNQSLCCYVRLFTFFLYLPYSKLNCISHNQLNTNQSMQLLCRLINQCKSFPIVDVATTSVCVCAKVCKSFQYQRHQFPFGNDDFRRLEKNLAIKSSAIFAARSSWEWQLFAAADNGLTKLPQGCFSHWTINPGHCSAGHD